MFVSRLSFCHSIILSETLTLLITFDRWVLEFWYLTWVFLVIRSFREYHYIWPCDLDRGVLLNFWKLQLAYNFWTVSARALIFHMGIPCDKTFLWIPIVFTLWSWPWSLIYFFENFNLAATFLSVSYSFNVSHEYSLWQDLSVSTTSLTSDLDHGVWPIFWKM